MPDFTVRIVSAPGLAVVPWVDPATVSAPSRLNANPIRLPTYYKVVPSGTVDIRAKVAGVEGPLDAALGGRLFKASWAKWSGTSPPAITQAAGQSSHCTFPISSIHLGHFIFLLWREGGGAVAIPFNVET